MEILNSYSGNGTTFYHEHKRYTNFIDLDYNYKFLGEVFRVDDLLDFSNDDIAGPIAPADASAEAKADMSNDGEGAVKVDDPQQQQEVSVSEEEPVSVSVTAEEDSKADEELELIGMQCDDIPELEWLSSLVDDSSSIDHPAAAVAAAEAAAAAAVAAASGTYAGTTYPFKSSSRDYKEFSDEVKEESRLVAFSSNNSGACWKSTTSTVTNNVNYLDMSSSGGGVPGRARSKRSRTGTRVWYNSTTTSSATSSENNSESSASLLEDTSTTTVSIQQQCCSSSFSADSDGTDQELDDQFVVPVQRPAKKICSSSNGSSSGSGSMLMMSGSSRSKKQESVQLQKCLHCGSQKTPQWRTGPLGPKTLCNACGVRFKSGRLFPEYRPAASPSFVPQKHSNSHKKVLEMRKHKEGPTTTASTTTDDEEEAY